MFVNPCAHVDIAIFNGVPARCPHDLVLPCLCALQAWTPLCLWVVSGSARQRWRAIRGTLLSLAIPFRRHCVIVEVLRLLTAVVLLRFRHGAGALDALLFHKVLGQKILH